MKRFPWLLFLPLALLLSACRKEESSHAGGTNAPTTEAGSEAEEIPTTYEVKGVVRKINSDRNQLVVKHEEIPGFMAAMTMPFDVRPTNEMSKVKPGDRIAFRMLVTTNDGWIDSIRVIDKETNVVADPSPPPRLAGPRSRAPGREQAIDDPPPLPSGSLVVAALHLPPPPPPPPLGDGN